MTLKLKCFNEISDSIKITNPPPILVYNDAQLAITDIQLLNNSTDKNNNNLNKKQLFYAKLSCSGSDNRIYRTECLKEAKWENLNFLFPADKSSELKIRLKFNFGGSKLFWAYRRSSRNLIGEANIPFTLTTLGYSNLNKNCLNLTSSYSSSSEKPSSISSSNYSIDKNNNTRINSKMEKCLANSPPSNSMSASSSSSDNFSKLPKGWEMRVDGQGRIFYIDHIRQKTAWTPPVNFYYFQYTGMIEIKCILEALEESEYLNKNCENICDENRFIRQTMEFSKNNINNNLTIPQT
uniref:WW domain-containing protein n=1 Tax=Meloidogyne floridensis TaxID=298350 RepID=A0A915NDW2_9BILA